MTDTMVEPEVKKDNSKVEVMLAQLGRSVEELRSTDAWKAMLKVAGRFHKYSASNQFMIWMQNPEATRVAGYRQWEAMGRQVQKGERGIKIFAPMTRKEQADNGSEVTKIFGFKLVSVFDISQTEGDPLNEIPWPEASGCPAGTYESILTHVEGLGFEVELVGAPDSPFDPHPSARGWCKPDQGKIWVREASVPGMAATLLHECGHLLDPKVTTDPDYQCKELVAESVSYILGLRMGIELEDEVHHYLASWKGTVDGLLAVVDRVKQAVAAYDGERVAS